MERSSFTAALCASRPLYGAQAQPQPQPQPQSQYYDNPGYAQPAQGYYQPRPYPRGYYYQN